jgi:mono/diheme cytochrome c family protein
MSRALLLLLLLPALCACEKHMQGMYDQPRYKPLDESAVFQDGGASRAPVPDTQAYSQGDFAGTSSGRIGVEDVQRRDRDVHAQTNPYPLTAALLHRGQQRFEIYCTPCHSALGDGDGLVVRKGFPSPPSFHIERLRAASDRHIFDVITDGYGVMYSYGARVQPADRWAIVAYIRALQLSQHVDAAQLTAADTGHLEQAQ